ncbi:MAG: hypothetical protein F6K36_24325 [Symploca sp. SIO3C6]|nr:hypothetical protein [Symploca sp. SIO3C6]NEO99100.1 hypothetical protein [Symploca sp. SIO2E9]
MNGNKESTSTKKKPTHEVFQVIDAGGDNKYWNRIGAAWLHDDEAGVSVVLNAVPIDGRLVIRKAKQKEKSK